MTKTSIPPPLLSTLRLLLLLFEVIFNEMDSNVCQLNLEMKKTLLVTYKFILVIDMPM